MATQEWRNGATGDWANPANWVSGSVPLASDDVTITGDSGVTITTAANANSLVLNSATISAITGTLTLTQGVTLNGSGLDLLGGTVVAPDGIEANSGWGQINGYGTIDGDLSGNVSIDAYSSQSSGTLSISGSITGNVSASIQYGMTLELGGAAFASVFFEGSNGTLKLDDLAGFTGSVSNVNVGNTIDLAGTPVSGVAYDGATLTITEVGGAQFSFAVSGNLGGDTVTFASDGNGGTDITWAYPPDAWANGATGDWSSAANWISGSVPGFADNINIANAMGVTITTAANVNSLVLNGTNVSKVTGTLTVGQELTLNNSYVNDITGTISLGAGLALNSGSDLALAGGTLAAPGGVAGSGWIGGYGTVDGNVANVAIDAFSGTLTVSGSFNGGWAYIGSGAALQLGGASSSYYYFQGGTSTLQLGDPTDFTGWIGDVNPGNTIDLAGISVSGVSYDGSNLTVTETNGQKLSLAVSGQLTGDSATYTGDGNGGTDIQWAYPAGTWVSGAKGDWSNAAS